VNLIDLNFRCGVVQFYRFSQFRKTLGCFRKTLVISED